MTELEYQQSGCNNKHSKFTFKNGDVTYGVITIFFPTETGAYYLVRSPQMIEFKKFMDKNDYDKMKTLCSPIRLEELEKAELLDSFGQLLVKKSEEVEENEVNWEARKKTWLQSTDSLFNNIQDWLSDYQKAGLLDIKEKEIDLNEEYLGNYKTKRLEIRLGYDVITLTPKGTLIIGSYGRVDMRGPKGEALIVEPNWNDWKFAVRTPKMQYWEVNEQSFKNAIQEVING